MEVEYEVFQFEANTMGESGINATNQQLLTLKVMRLSRPKFYPVTGLSVDPCDEISCAVEEGLCKRTGENSHQFAVGEFLIAPQQFESIYLGETFTFYVNCVNESAEQVTDVTVKVDLQTNSQRQTLPCTIENTVLESLEAKGQVISHEVKEIGQHILVCSVIYKTASGNLSFRKFFKFPVTKPIDVRTKFYNAESNDVFLEAQIENTSLAPMVLEKVDLEPSDYYTSTAINPVRSSEWSSLLRPKDIRQFLFCLTPKENKQPGVAAYKEVTNIGKLDMAWRTAMGERGRLQTSALQRIAPGYGEVRLTVERVPATVRVRQPFEVSCRLHNCCDRSLDLYLSFDGTRQPSLVFCCTSGVSLGQVPPNGHIDFSMELVPVTLGFQSLSGIRVQDTFNKRTYEFDDVAQVFVM